LYIYNTGWHGPGYYSLDLLRVYFDSVPIYYQAQELSLINSKFILCKLCKQASFSKLLEDFLDILGILRSGLAIDQDIIKVSSIEDIQIILQGIIYIVLEYYRGTGKTKKYN
jgi:hypothetical protein